MTREMRAPDGAFFSSLDADSEGEEGKFYVWSRDEVRALLVRRRIRGRRAALGARWRRRISRAMPGTCALRDPARARSPRRSGLSVPEARRAARAREATLFAARAKRVRPGLDDKILTSWNALAIAGLARAARALDEPRVGGSRASGDRCAARDRLARRAPARDTQRTSARISTPISTTTRSCSTRCSSSCRRDFAARISTGHARSPTCCSRSSRTARTAASSSRATITSVSTIAPSPDPTMRRRPATASPRRR